MRSALSTQPLEPSLEPIDTLLPLIPADGVSLARLAEVSSACRAGGPLRVDVTGVYGCASAFVAAELLRKGKGPLVFVVPSAEDVPLVAEDLRFLLGGGPSDNRQSDRVLLFAGSEHSPYAATQPDRRTAMSRLATLAHLVQERPWDVLVVAAGALVRKVVPRSVMKGQTVHLRGNSTFHRDRFVDQLVEQGYSRVPLVEDPGSFAVRGGLLDVWAFHAEPVRMEWQGDRLISLKLFDPVDQRIRKEREKEVTLQELWIPPAREAVLTPATTERARAAVKRLADTTEWPTSQVHALLDDIVHGRAFFGAEGYLPAYYEELESLFRYLPPHAMLLLDDPPACTRAVREELARAASDAAAKSGRPLFPCDALYDTEDHLVEHLATRTVLPLHRTQIHGGTGEGLAVYEQAKGTLHLGTHDQSDLLRAGKATRVAKGKNALLAPLVRRLTHWREHGLQTFLTARTQMQAERLATLLSHQGVLCQVHLDPFSTRWLTDKTGLDTVQIVLGTLSRGAVLPAEGVALATEEEVFGSRLHRTQEKKKRELPELFAEDLGSLALGDFVVHVEHGIGRYQGLLHREIGGKKVDLLLVEYAGGDKLYLPVHRLNQIQPYTGQAHSTPRLDRLGGSTFAQSKAKVSKEVRQMADELLQLYAARQAQPGEAIPPVDDHYRAFEAAFPFEETPDQVRAIEDVNRDLETPRPMDRLVCGDVGFGKTEIALRAAFRMAMHGKQVAVLCPTTVLAQQHFFTFSSRMHAYGIVVAPLSRFQSKKEQDTTLAALKEGKVDVVIGTHRLLSKDIHFKRLGLMIVDEEQRFGVAHKERMKQMRTQMDVLTLTATPIPRTLQMAASGLRDLSLITTPPVDRRAVRTLVTSFDEQEIREAIVRELGRGGQVFYVYNRIEGLYEKAQRIRELVPEARVVVGHGQMVQGKQKEGETHALEQVMVDFVDGRYDVLVATAIVESGLDIPRANTMLIDRADLFGLAQLYQLRGRVGRSKERAYCYLIVPPSNTLSEEARLRIDAMERHTELGSGFQIASLDLELRGAGDLLGAEQSGNVARVGFDLFCRMLDEAVHELQGDPVVHDIDPDLSFDEEAFLPEEYMTEVGIRLSFYKRFASATDEPHVAELAQEMEERFGPPPPEAKKFVQLMALKTELRSLRVLGCEANRRSVTLHLRSDTPLDPQRVTALVHAPKSPYRLTPDMRLTRRFDEGVSGLANAAVLLQALAPCRAGAPPSRAS